MSLMLAIKVCCLALVAKSIAVDAQVTTTTTAPSRETTTELLTPETVPPKQMSTPNWQFLLWQMKCKRDCINLYQATGYSATRGYATVINGSDRAVWKCELLCQVREQLNKADQLDQQMANLLLLAPILALTTLLLAFQN